MKTKNRSVRAVRSLYALAFLGLFFAFGGIVQAADSTVSQSAATSTPPVIVYTANLSGVNETPPVSTNMTGTARLLFNASTTQAVVLVNVQNGASIISAHIHCGKSGQSGPAVATLFDQSSGSSGINGVLTVKSLADGDISASTCNSQSIKSLADAAAQGNLYVNVHTTDHPNGAIRGQLAFDASASTAPQVSGSGAITQTTSPTGAVATSTTVTSTSQTSPASSAANKTASSTVSFSSQSSAAPSPTPSQFAPEALRGNQSSNFGQSYVGNPVAPRSQSVRPEYVPMLNNLSTALSRLYGVLSGIMGTLSMRS